MKLFLRLVLLVTTVFFVSALSWADPSSALSGADLPEDEINQKYYDSNIFPREATVPDENAIKKELDQIRSGVIKHPLIKIKLTRQQAFDQMKAKYIENNRRLITPKMYFIEKEDEIMFVDEDLLTLLRPRIPKLKTTNIGEITSINFDELKNIDLNKIGASPKPRSAPLLQSAPLPAQWRMSNKYIQNHARNQGNCGSCATFAAVAIMEAKRARRDTTDVDQYNISEQMILNCSNNNCDGGYPSEALAYAAWAGNSSFGKPLPNEGNSPYKAADEPCDVTKPRRYWANSHGSVATDRNTLKRSLQQYGPLAICIYANDQFNAYYGKDTVITLPSDQTWANHCVELLGWSNNKNAWLVRNSWGDAWGKNGIGWIHYSSKIYFADWVRMNYPGD